MIIKNIIVADYFMQNIYIIRSKNRWVYSLNSILNKNVILWNIYNYNLHLFLLLYYIHCYTSRNMHYYAILSI